LKIEIIIDFYPETNRTVVSMIEKILNSQMQEQSKLHNTMIKRINVCTIND